MATSATLVAPVVRLESATFTAARRSTASATSTTASTTAGRELYPGAPAGNRTPIQPADRILRIARILKLDEGKAGRIAGNPHVPQRSIIPERFLDVLFASVVT